MSGNKALKRALQTKDSIRIGTNIPLITDETLFVDPPVAEEMLKKNKKNRPVNWRKVEEYSKIMKKGEWKLHSQGIILDETGNLLTGQNRLWAIVHSGVAVYMRVSKGNRAEVANLLDRGRPQTARDLASRETEKRHSPIEAMIARGMLVLKGSMRPSIDEVGKMIVENSEMVALLLPKTAGMKKTKAIIMILAAICVMGDQGKAIKMILNISHFADELEGALAPITPEKCWGKGTAFGMAMVLAQKCLK
jgi:hypothetical protein